MATIILLSDLVTVSTVDDVLALELSLATQLNLPVTSWQPLDPSRTIFQTEANIYSSVSAVIAGIAQGGYLSYAAVMPAGNSPYNDGAGFLTTWMDLRGVDTYNVARIGATAAAGPIPVQNITAAAQPYTAGQLHFQHPTSGATYTNTGPGTVTGGGTVGSPVASTIEVTADPDFVGAIGTLSSGQTAIMLTPFPGVTPTAQGTNGTGSIIGTAIEQNAHYLVRCQGKLAALSPNGASQAYQYVATSLPVFGSNIIPPSDILDLSESPVSAIATAAQDLLTALGFTSGTQYYTAPTAANPWGVSTPVTRARAFLNTATGVVDVYAANAAGGLAGCAQLTITNVTWSSGSGGVATVTTASAHDLSSSNWVIISGVQGASGVNNQIAGTPAWQLLSASGSTFTFALATNPGTFTSGGSVEGGDLGSVDAAIQAQVVPDGQTAIVAAATNANITVTATVYIPTKAGVSPAVAKSNISTALATYLATVPIGGVTAESTGIVPGSELLVTIANANPGTVSVQPTPSDVVLSNSQVPVLSSANITVVFV